MSATKTTAVPKLRRVRIYTRLSHALRTRLLAFCAATGRSERAVIEEAVERYLANPGKSAAHSGPLERLVQAIDDDRRQRQLEHRDLEILSEAFGRFMRLWLGTVHPLVAEQGKGAELRKAGELAYEKFARFVADQFLDGHRFVHDLPKVAEPTNASAK
jgi:hypothetical protein